MPDEVAGCDALNGDAEVRAPLVVGRAVCSGEHESTEIETMAAPISRLYLRSHTSGTSLFRHALDTHWRDDSTGLRDTIRPFG